MSKVSRSAVGAQGAGSADSNGHTAAQQAGGALLGVSTSSSSAFANLYLGKVWKQPPVSVGMHAILHHWLDTSAQLSTQPCMLSSVAALQLAGGISRPDLIAVCCAAAVPPLDCISAQQAVVDDPRVWDRRPAAAPRSSVSPCGSEPFLAQACIWLQEWPGAGLSHCPQVIAHSMAASCMACSSLPHCHKASHTKQ